MIFDAIEMLKQEHGAIREHFRLFELARERRQIERIAKLVCGELHIHAKVEEEQLYPLLREACGTEGERAFQECHQAHMEIERQIHWLGHHDRADSGEFHVGFRELIGMMEAHMQREESRVFPILRKRIDERALTEVGRRIKARRTELVASEEIGAKAAHEAA